MKLSLCLTPAPTVFAPLLYAGDLMRGLRRCQELGYDGVELNLRDPETEDLDAIVAAAKARGLAIISLGTGQAYLMDGLSLASPDPTVRARLVTRVKSQIDFAARVGAQVVIGGARGRFDGDAAARRAQYAGAVEALRQLADYAAAKDVTITVEPINRYESNFLNTVDDTLAFLADVDRPELKMLFDTFHMNIEEADMCAGIERAGSRLSHVHFVDSNRRAPGLGHIDFRPILATLRSIGYDRYLSGEFLPLPDDDTGAEQNVRYVRSLLA